MSEKKYPKFCDIRVRCGASSSVAIKMIRSSHIVYEGIGEDGRHYTFKRDQILTSEQIAEEVAERKFRSMAVGTARSLDADVKDGMTDFTRSLFEKASSEKAKVDMLKEQRATASMGTKAQSKSKEDKQKPSEYHESQVSCL